VERSGRDIAVCAALQGSSGAAEQGAHLLLVPAGSRALDQLISARAPAEITTAVQPSAGLIHLMTDHPWLPGWINRSSRTTYNR
jgi:hypothetical protein